MIRKLTAASALILLVTACATDPNVRAKRGAAIGAAAGAVAGAIVGNQSGNPETGAVVGAAAGAAIGGTVGHRMDQQQRELQQINGVEVNRTADDELDVVLKNDVLFDTGSYSLRSESRSTLVEMSRVFNRYNDTTIAVDGHTDSVGSSSSNQVLSERRAGSVRGYLVDQGVSSSRIIARGYGETQPKASNDTPEGRQLNRRVELHVKANRA